MPIEDADERDLPGILAILNDVIATSTAVFSDDPVTLPEQREWLLRRRERGFPVLVVRDGDEVLAYASYGDFRPHPGYRTTVEHTVHVAAAARRRGIGRELVTRLIELAREDGMHVMVAGVDATNEPSIALHEQLGFVESAREERCTRRSRPLGRPGAADPRPLWPGRRRVRRPPLRPGAAAGNGSPRPRRGIVEERDVARAERHVSAHGSIARARGACRR